MTDERPYTKRELDTFKEEMKDRFSKQDDVLESILEQAKKTNGRVNGHDSLIRGLIMSGAVVVFLGGVIIGLVIYIYQYQLSQQATRITNLKSEVQTLQNK